MRKLCDDIEGFLAKHQLAPTTFGELALNDRHFVRQIKGGRRVWPETEAKVRRFMSEYRADGSSKQGAAA